MLGRRVRFPFFAVPTAAPSINLTPIAEQFIRDHKRGLADQHYVAEMCRSWGWECEDVPEASFPGYDLRLENGRTVDVKYDLKASSTTGRIFLEDDALAHSNADYLAIVTDNPRTIYLIPLSEAKKIANQSKKVRGGEYGGWGANRLS